MEYTHRDGDRAASSIKVPGVGSVPVEDGRFEADPDEDVHDRLVEIGHEPVVECTCGPNEACDVCGGSRQQDPPDGEEGDVDEEPEGQGRAEPEEEAEPPRAADFTEQELVQMGRNDLRSIAAGYEDINGNAGGDKLTEELIKQRREEESVVDDEVAEEIVDAAEAVDSETLAEAAEEKPADPREEPDDSEPEDVEDVEDVDAEIEPEPADVEEEAEEEGGE